MPLAWLPQPAAATSTDKDCTGPKTNPKLGVRRNLVRRHVGVLVAANRVSVLGGRRFLVGAWADRRAPWQRFGRERRRERERGEDVDENAGGTT